MRVRDIALERFRARRQEEGIVAAPDGQKARLVRAEVGLEFRIDGDVALVVAEEIELDLVRARTLEIMVVERVSIRGDQGRVRHAVGVLPDRRLRRKE